MKNSILALFIITILSALNSSKLFAQNLIVQSPAVTPSTIVRGNGVSLTCTVKNLGTATANFSWAQTDGLWYFWSNNSTWDSGDTKIGTTNIDDFVGGESRFISGPNYTVSSNTAPGTYYIIFYVDYPNYITETNNEDNTNFASVIITIPNSNPTKPGIPTFSSITKTSVSISWTSSTDADGNPITYDIQYGKRWTAGWTEISNVSKPYTLTGLLEDQEYTVQVRAKDNQGGISGWTSDGYITTLTNSIPTKPGIPTFSSITETSVSISWTSSTDADGNPITYDIQYGKRWTAGWTEISNVSKPYTLTGLLEDQEYTVQVRAKDNQGGISDWTSTGYFTTEVNDAPVAPSNISPAADASNISLNPSFSWTCSDPNGDNLTYEFMYKKGIFGGWTSYNTTNKNYSLSGLEFNQDYYWKVFATDAHGEVTKSHSDIQNGWRFTTEVNDAPVPPSNISPAADASNISLNPSFSWTCSDPNGDNLTYEFMYKKGIFGGWTSYNTTSKNYSLSGLEFNQDYYWKVFATDAHGEVTKSHSDIQNGWKFTTEVNDAPVPPSIIAPSSGAINISLNPSFSWTCSDPNGDNLTYEFMYKKGIFGGWTSYNTTSKSYSLSGLEFNQDYYWKVFATDAHGEVTKSHSDIQNGWRFTTEVNDAPVEPSNISPAADAVNVSLNPSFSWTCSDPNGDNLTYEFMYKKGIFGGWTSYNTTNKYYSLSGLEFDQDYYWKVFATDEHGEVAKSHSDIQNGWRFTTEINDAPVEPSNISPAADAVNVSLNPSFSWTCSDPNGDNLTYEFMYKKGIFGGWTSYNTTNKNYSLSGLEFDQDYYWKVFATDEHGEVAKSHSDIQNGWRFTTEVNDAPVEPSNISPAADAVNVSLNPSFSWTCSDPNGDNLTYEFMYKKGIFGGWTSYNMTNKNYSLSGLEFDQDYYWKVFATDEHGEVTKSHSDIQNGWRFTTEVNDAPVEPSNISPAADAVNVSLNPSFSWTCSDPNGDNLTYEFMYKKGLFGDWTSVNTSIANYSISGLEYNQDYYWKVFATDEHGEVTKSHSDIQNGWKFTTELPEKTHLNRTEPSNENNFIAGMNINEQSIKLFFSENLDPSSVTVENVFVKYSGGESIPVSLTYTEKNILFGAKIEIAFNESLTGGQYYEIVITENLVDKYGTSVKPENILFQVEVSDQQFSNLESALNTNLIQFTNGFNLSNNRFDIWKEIENENAKINAEKTINLNFILNSGFASPQILHDQKTGPFYIDNKEYFVVPVEWTTKNNAVFKDFAVLDGSTLVTSEEVAFKVFLTNYSVNIMDPGLYSEYSNALDWINKMQLLNNALVDIRDAAFSAILAVPGTQKEAFAKSFVENLISLDGLPEKIFELSLTQRNIELQDQFNLGVTFAGSQGQQARTNYHDASYAFWLDTYLTDDAYLFVDLTDQFWKERADLGNQLEALKSVAVDKLVDLILSDKDLKDIRNIFNVLNDIYSNVSFINDCYSTFISGKEYLQAIEKERLKCRSIYYDGMITSSTMATVIADLFYNPITSLPPYTPSNNSPSGNINTFNPIFSWGSFYTDQIDGYQRGYQLRVRNSNDVIIYDTGLLEDQNGNSHQYQPAGTYIGLDPITNEERISLDLICGETYHWHIRYLDNNGLWSNWSADTPDEQFLFNIESPNIPVIGTISQPTCDIETGSVELQNLPNSEEWTILPGNIVGNSPNYTISDLSSGTYSFSVRNNLGCISGGSEEFVIDPQPLVPESPVVGPIIQPTCEIGTGSVELSGLPDENWMISPGSATGSTSSETVVGLAPGVYNFTISNSAGCISSPSGDVEIYTQPGIPMPPQIGLITQPTCDLATGSVILTGLPDGNWTINPGTLSGSTPTKVVSNLSSGVYNFTVINAEGCTSIPSGNVIIDTQPSSPSPPLLGVITQPTCELAAGSIELVGLPNGNWIITPGNIEGSASNYNISGLSSGSYNFLVTNENGCVSVPSDNAVINSQLTLPKKPENIIGNTNVLAESIETYSIPSVEGADSYTWTLPLGWTGNSSTTSIITTVGSTSGIISVVANNECGISISQSLSVGINCNPPSKPEPIFGKTNVSVGEQLTYSITEIADAISYSWTIPIDWIGSSNSNSIQVTVGSNSGLISVYANNDCTTGTPQILDVSISSNVPQAPLIVEIIQPTCTIATGSVEFTDLPEIGNWTLIRIPGDVITNGSGKTATISGLEVGTYTFTVKNSNEISSLPSEAIVINIPQETIETPEVTVTQPTCEISTGTITITSPKETGMTYSIDGTNYTNTDGIFSLLSAGTYTVSAKNMDGCISTGVIVQIDSPPASPETPIIQITQPTCLVPTGTITVISPKEIGMAYGIFGEVSILVTNYTNTDGVFPLLSPGNYEVKAKNMAGCISTGISVPIDSPPDSPATPNIIIAQPTCSISTGTITITSPKEIGMMYNVRVGQVLLSSNTNGVFQLLSAGTYSVSAENIYGCSSPPIGVPIDPPPASPTTPIITISQPTCLIPTGTITVTSPKETGMSYSIDGASYTNTDGIFSLLSPDNYIVKAKNMDGCISTGVPGKIDSAANVPPAPGVGPITDPTCVIPTGNVFLYGLPAVGTWTVTRIPGDIKTTGKGTGVTISEIPTGNFTFSVKTESGCTSNPSENVEINMPPAPPSAPIVGPITQTSCIVEFGDVFLYGLPAKGTWTLTRNPDGNVTPGKGTGVKITEIPSGNYSFTVTDESGCTSNPSENVGIIMPPTPPSAPIVGPIAQPYCKIEKGSVFLYGLPGTGNWTIIKTPGEVKTTGSGTGLTITGLESGSYSFSVKDDLGCISDQSNSIVINPAQTIPNTSTSITNGCADNAIFGGSLLSYGDTTISSAGVCWGLSPKPTSEIIGEIDDNGTITCKISGIVQGVTYYIRSYATNCVGKGYGPDSIYACPPTGLDMIQIAEISVFPNPVNGMLNIDFNNENYTTINILNSQGGLITKEKALAPKQQLDFSKYKSGVYILEFVKTSGDTRRIKVVNYE